MCEQSTKVGVKQDQVPTVPLNHSPCSAHGNAGERWWRNLHCDSRSHLGDPGGWRYGCCTPLNHSPCRMEALYKLARGGRENYIVIQDPTQGTRGDRGVVVFLSCLENGRSFSIFGEFNETFDVRRVDCFLLFLKKCSSTLH